MSLALSVLLLHVFVLPSKRELILDPCSLDRGRARQNASVSSAATIEATVGYTFWIVGGGTGSIGAVTVKKPVLPQGAKIQTKIDRITALAQKDEEPVDSFGAKPPFLTLQVSTVDYWPSGGVRNTNMALFGTSTGTQCMSRFVCHATLSGNSSTS